MVEDATGGKVKVVTYPRGVLGGAREAYEMATTGVVDISWQYIGLFKDRMPLAEVTLLPMMGFKEPGSAETAGRIAWELYQKFPEMQAHFSDVKLLFFHASVPSLICTVDKKVLTMDDIKGLKIRSPGGLVADFLKGLGASVVMMPMPELYTALQTGVVDGGLTDWQANGSFRLIELYRYYLQLEVASPGFFTIMNLDKWNRLPPDVQQAIESVSGHVANELYASIWEKPVAPAIAEAKELGSEITPISADEYARWQEVAEGIHNKWIANIEAKGLPGQAVYDETIRLAKQYAK